MKPSGPLVLVVDDESLIADTLVAILKNSGFHACAAYDAEEAMELSLLNPPSMLISDVMLPGMNGIELGVEIGRIFPDCKVLLFSGQIGTGDLMKSADEGGHHFEVLAKPVPPSEFLRLVGVALARP